ncbi:hypothetical protein [Mariprofundus sp. KV]|uniref:hypothetical protein n=1 Tax=Mariprofundus sp. KV TaxID=2608715 RepID=UPI0015A2DFEE|nr:hypothetical protein [Mariprofundus sp. KV]NWF36671.1 hypothetical protein [Mariprofundus sp. KV]
MAFRADESASSGIESVRNYLIPRGIEAGERERSEDKLFDIVNKYGPAVESYPSWHPLVTHHNDHSPATVPSDSCGYKGLDHTRYFVNAFITCPYDDGQEIMDSVEALPYNPFAKITAERLDVQMYQSHATPILVRCDWIKPISNNGMIPASVAIPLMLQKEVPCWEWATCGETWETMRPYFLGSPHGSRSSLFVNQETGLTMKKVWNLLINTGMFGNIKVSNQS